MPNFQTTNLKTKVKEKIDISMLVSLLLIAAVAGVVLGTMLAGVASLSYKKATQPAKPISTKMSDKKNFSGYIVKFKEEPLALKVKQLKGKSGNNILSSLDKKELSEHKNRIEQTHKLFSTKMIQEYPQRKILSQYKNTFNGVGVDITSEEATKLKKMDYIDEIYPNLEVEATTMDTIPLINADDVWALIDSNGLNLTGEGIDIGILDTGVDYTHQDLGDCADFVYQSFSDIPYEYNNTSTYNSTYSYELLYQETFTIEDDNKFQVNFDLNILGKAVFIITDQDGSTFFSRMGDYSGENLFTGKMDNSSFSISIFSLMPGDGSWDFTINAIRSFSEPQYNCIKVPGGYDFINNDFDPMDDNKHGTHVASIAAANGGLKGVAPDAKIYAYKVLNSAGSGDMITVIKAIERTVDPNEDGDLSDHLDVINLSLSADCSDGYTQDCGPDDPISQAVDNAVGLGVVAVTSAGNKGPNAGTIGSPGTARHAITVGSSYKESYDFDFPWSSVCMDEYPRVDDVVCKSSKGPVTWIDENNISQILTKPDVVAPGAGICAARLSAVPITKPCFTNDYYRLMSGTSMAAPHVTGAVALIKQAFPDWTPEEIKLALKSTAVDTGFDINSQGSGRIDVLAALNVFPQCLDGLDNDNDGAIDFPQDFGCVSADDDNEINISDIECSDGLDNDNDGSIDQDDSNCNDSNDDAEQATCLEAPQDCIVTCEIGQLMGDIDQNSHIDLDDATIAQNIFVGTTNMPEDTCCIDMDKDNDFDLFDILEIIDIANGISESPGFCGEECPFGGCKCRKKSIIGDINRDGNVTQNDAVIARSMFMGSMELPKDICCIDIDKDDDVDLYDILEIIDIANGISESPGVCR